MKRLFVNMVGTLTMWQAPSSLEELVRPDFFQGMMPRDTIVTAIKQIMVSCPNVEVFVIINALDSNKTCIHECKVWLDKFLPEVDAAHRLYFPVSEEKALDVADATGRWQAKGDFLLDGDSRSIEKWITAGGAGVKLLIHNFFDDGFLPDSDKDIPSGAHTLCGALSKEEVSAHLCACLRYPN